jgi:hypothetical protein
VIAPAGSEERTDPQDQAPRRATVYADLDADVAAVDRLIPVDGTRRQVLGEPLRYRSPYAPAGSAQAHIEGLPW